MDGLITVAHSALLVLVLGDLSLGVDHLPVGKEVRILQRVEIFSVAQLDALSL